ncbi:YncE family protein [Balneolaceae bacterium YR4-1]|uniref:YncE family protein n=1 Tax=Halalkalibaculum roseum TaxID=2709311 RepID=A0A6M1SKE9_9BACT|nr:YncE family protein [Halalkalibaculum roseum]NGP75781.1 YncE family protein [Halalkalibaculum roseum]
MIFSKAAKILFLAATVFVIGNNIGQAQNYYLYVALESEDEVSLIRYDGETNQGTIKETIKVGVYPTENEGPHGLTVSPDGDYWFVSIAHGNPYGKLWKYNTETNELVGQTELGMFPASMEISEKTGLLYVVNFNLHGDMEPSTVSVVDPESMTLVADIETGIMPHGSRINSDGSYQYHVSMMTDELIQVNTSDLKISKRLHLAGDKDTHSSGMSSGMQTNEVHAEPICKPTWADPHPTENIVYVACNGSDTIVEVNTKEWKVTRRFQTGKAPYNLEVSHDGRLLVASYKGEGATGVWDLNSGKELARIQNSRRVSHGVAISPDNRYAFISMEGVGGEPGSVDVIDLEELNRATVVETGKQAGGIIMWKVED